MLLDSVDGWGTQFTLEIESLTEDEASLVVRTRGSAQRDMMVIEHWVLRRMGEYLYVFLYRASERSFDVMRPIFEASVETIVVELE